MSAAAVTSAVLLAPFRVAAACPQGDFPVSHRGLSNQVFMVFSFLCRAGGPHNRPSVVGSVLWFVLTSQGVGAPICGIALQSAVPQPAVAYTT